MLLLVDALAVLVFRLVQAGLLGFGDVSIVLGLIDRLPLGDVRVMFLVTCGLFSCHCPVRDALVDTCLLIVEALIHFVLARMVGYRSGLCHCLHGHERGAYRTRDAYVKTRRLHDVSLNG